ncbi:hypothetical protein H4R20_007343, partial [Coemansia guatemalensis]
MADVGVPRHRPQIEILKKVVPIASLLQCRVVRTKDHKKQAKFDLFEEGEDGLVEGINDELGPHVLRILPDQGTRSRRHYTMYLPPPPHSSAATETGRGETVGRPVGRVESDSLGTDFRIYDCSWSGRESDGEGVHWREVCAVHYQVIRLSKGGPRRMTVVMHAVDKHGTRCKSPAPSADLARSGLMERYRRFGATDTGIVVLENKLPRWNEENHSYMLDFFGRVTQPSVKNFQLVHPEDTDYTVAQFGKVGEDMFTLDLRFPMSPIMAVGIA